MAAVTIALGLLIRTTPVPLVLAKFGGVALWCALVYWLLVIWRPRDGVLRGSVIATAIGVGVELLQLTGLPRVVGEAVPLLRWVLGTTFVWGDLPAYVSGAAAAGLTHWLFRRLRARR